ncbi:hypothetical protein [uncultured Ilyobacter sp.]|uniref:hypothetical protein n=1 Tax=uncultured Ilyobacter sp. TaxID=544433 RepID=UPI0029C04C41|nr:hypothetical protein [uncultured Ilyobacter sp.]
MAVSKFCFSKEYSLDVEPIQCLPLDKFSCCKTQITVKGVTVYRESSLFNTCRNMG